MNIEKRYSFTNGRILWRLIPSGDKLLVEERDEENKQVYFNCLKIDSGKSVLKNFQPEEKFWVGVEAFEKDTIYFHRFIKPDMPGHIGITAYDLNSGNILWAREDLVFLFLHNREVYAFLQKFESREYFSLDARTGQLIKEYGEDAKEVNKVREELLRNENELYRNYYFPESYLPTKQASEFRDYIEKLKQAELISGPVELIKFKDLLLLSFHSVKDDGRFDNNFRIVDIGSEKVIFEDVVNTGISSYIPDTFFIKDDLLFLIREKTELVVFSLI